MHCISSCYNRYLSIWNAQPPSTWTYENIDHTRTVLKTAQEAEQVFTRIVLASIVLGAYAFKFMTSPLWLPTFLFATVTAIVCYVLCISYTGIAKQFVTWNELPENEVTEFIYSAFKKAINNSADGDKFLEQCEEIESNLDRSIVERLQNITHLSLIFHTHFSDEQKMNLLLAANKRKVLLLFPSLNLRENSFFILDYIKHIDQEMKLDSHLIEKIHIDTFNQQFQLLNRIGYELCGAESIALIDNKNMILFAAEHFPHELLIETCSSLKDKLKVGVVFNPDHAEDEVPFHELAEKYKNIRVKTLTTYELNDFSLSDLKPF